MWLCVHVCVYVCEFGWVGGCEWVGVLVSPYRTPPEECSNGTYSSEGKCAKVCKETACARTHLTHLQFGQVLALSVDISEEAV